MDTQCKRCAYKKVQLTAWQFREIEWLEEEGMHGVWCTKRQGLKVSRQYNCKEFKEL